MKQKILERLRNPSAKDLGVWYHVALILAFLWLALFKEYYGFAVIWTLSASMHYWKLKIDYTLIPLRYCFKGILSHLLKSALLGTMAAEISMLWSLSILQMEYEVANVFSLKILAYSGILLVTVSVAMFIYMLAYLIGNKTTESSDE